MKSLTVQIVRVHGPSHVALLRKLQRACFDPETYHDPKLPGFWWVAFVGNAAAGFARMTENADVGEAYLELGGVVEEFRGHGLQTLLIEARVEFATSIGLKRAVSLTARENFASANSLVKCGFRLTAPPKGERPSAQWLHWHKPLP